MNAEIVDIGGGLWNERMVLEEKEDKWWAVNESLSKLPRRTNFHDRDLGLLYLHLG